MGSPFPEAGPKEAEDGLSDVAKFTGEESIPERLPGSGTEPIHTQPEQRSGDRHANGWPFGSEPSGHRRECGPDCGGTDGHGAGVDRVQRVAKVADPNEALE